MTSKFDQMPHDVSRYIRELEKRIEALEARAGQRDPLTEASSGWRLPAMGEPDTSDLDAASGHIYFSGGRLTAKNGNNGQEVRLEPIPTAQHVDSILLGTASSTYGALEQNILNTCVSTINQILAELQAVDFMQ